MTTPTSITSGKRKTAIARAVVKEGEGRVRINKIPIEFYVPEISRLKILEPLILSGDKYKKLDISVDVRGGGITGQAEAARTAIANGIVKFLNDNELKKTYLAYDRSLLVNDIRIKEPKHQGGRGARKKRQKSYR